MNDDTIAAKLGMNPLPTPSGEDRPVTPVRTDDGLEADYAFARANIRGAIETAVEAAEEFRQIASQSQHPRAFEVLNTILDGIVRSSRELVEISRKMEETRGDDGAARPNEVHNHLYVGSTAELQRFINERRGN